MRGLLGSFSLGLALAIVLAVVVWGYVRPHLGLPPPSPGGETPEELLASLRRAWSDAQARQAPWIAPRLTAVGRELWTALAEQPPGEQPLIITWAGQARDGRYEIHHALAQDRPGEGIAWIFFFEDDRWKLHDIFIQHLGPVSWDMHLSLAVRNPAEAAGRLAAQNPGTAWEVAVGGQRLPSASVMLPGVRVRQLP